MTKSARVRAGLLAFAVSASCIPAVAATTPKPSPKPHAVPGPLIRLPDEPLHAEFLVEVNDKGQVVRVKSGKGSKSPTFNVQTYGNAMQMWIRRSNGTAQVGLYKVTYDYNPKTHAVHRGAPVLVSSGGSWANDEGAANRMMDVAKKEAQEAEKQREETDKKLPSLKQILGTSPKPSASPRF